MKNVSSKYDFGDSDVTLADYQEANPEVRFTEKNGEIREWMSRVAFQVVAKNIEPVKSLDEVFGSMMSGMVDEAGEASLPDPEQAWKNHQDYLDNAQPNVYRMQFDED